MKKLYICDRMRCAKCSYPVCKHTTDPKHAAIKAPDDQRTFENWNSKYLVEVDYPENGGECFAGKNIPQ